MASDSEILRAAIDFEKKRAPMLWDKSQVGATQADINRLQNEGLIELRHHGANLGGGQFGVALYKVTEKGRVQIASEELFEKVTAADVLEAMTYIVGFDDIKQTIAYAIEMQKWVHFMLEGPPASVKTSILQAIRDIVPTALMVFGSRTSARGLVDILLTKRPSILLMDEADKMRYDVFSLMLGVMESGEIIEAKSGHTSDTKLNLMVVAACNSSRKMPPEFLSRFALHAKFPKYNREEFFQVVRSMLSRAENCPPELADLISAQILDNNLGDVRSARGVYKLMKQPTAEEAIRVLRMKAKYSTGERPVKHTAVGTLI